MRLLFLLFFLTFTIQYLHSQGWMWSKHFNGSGQNIPQSSVQDINGNFYVYGVFNGTVTQDNYTLVSAGLQDIFLAKYDKTGQIVWIKAISGTATESAVSIVLSKDDNSFYISGTTNGSTSFDGTIINSTGGLDVFIAKYSTDGILSWVHNSVYGTGNQGNGNLFVDDSGNLIQLGTFSSTATFYGGVTTINDGTGIRQNYLAKFDGNGNFIWVKVLHDDNAITFAKTVSVSSDGYYISGIFQGNLILDLGTLTSTALNDGFLYKTDVNGIGQWVRKITGSGDEIINRHLGDISGNQYLTGSFNGIKLKIDSTATDTSKTPGLNTNSGTNDVFLIKYSPSGILQWVKTIGTTSNDIAYNLDIVSGGAIITGSYEGKLDFDGFTLNSSGLSDAFIIECNSSGQFISAKSAAGKANDVGKVCIYSSTGRNYVTSGEFYSDTLTIGSDQLVNSSTLRDSYIAKYGCFDSLSFQTTPVNCLDGGGIPMYDDGTATATPSEGSEPYTYVWSNGATTSAITGLGIGSYSVTVSGAYGCTLSGSVNVGFKPTLEASITNVTNILCNGSSTGSATVTASKGNPPYTYLWTNGNTTPTISNVVAGTYKVTVTDQCYNEIVSTVVITQPAILNTSISLQTNISCNGGNNGSATVSVSGGTSPFTYLWNDPAPAQTTATCTGLTSGTWRVTVSDANGCTSTSNVTITQPALLSSSIIAKANVSCNGGSNGSATASVSGGVSPYTYLWNDPAPAQTSPTCTGLTAGTWTVTVTDNNGCTTSTNAIIAQPAIIVANVTQTNVSCYGGNNGTATANVSGGTPGYTYLWSNAQTTAGISGLIAGNYTLTVTDANNCTITSGALITQPFALTATTSKTDVTCNNGYNGTATVTVSGGTSPYTYLWNDPAPAQTTSTCTSLTAGTWTVTVSDGNGCTLTKPITITQPTTIVAFIASQTNVSCFGGLNGTATATCTGGSGGRTYLWNDPAPAQNTATCSNLSAGIWNVTVTRSGSCGVAFVTITQPTTAVSSYISSQTNVTCNGLSDGSATVTASGGTPGYTYSWSGGGTNATNNNLSSGTYIVTVLDTKSCSSTSTAIITQPAAITFGIPTIICSNASPNCTGSIAAYPAGGTQPYSYYWSDASHQTSQMASNLCPDRYRVDVTDANGCTQRSNRWRVNTCAKSMGAEDNNSDFEKANKISLYPNPVSSQLSLLISSEENDGESTSITIELYNMLGELVSTDKMEIIFGQPLLKDVSEYLTGLYFVTVIDGNERFTQKILIKK